MLLAEPWLQFALAQPGIETLSKTYGENDVKVVGDILTVRDLISPVKIIVSVVSDYQINRTPHAEVLTHQPCARITLAGTVENIFKSSASFTLNILQYISLFGKKSKPVVPIKCIIPKSPKWPEPAKLLPYPGTTVVCAGSYVGYEMEQVNDAEVLRIIVDIDVIEFLTPKFDPAAISSPSEPPVFEESLHYHSTMMANHRSDKEQVRTTDPILAKSRYRQRIGRTSSMSPSPKVLGKRPMGPSDADDGSDTSARQPSPKRQAESVVSTPTGGSDFSSD